MCNEIVLRAELLRDVSSIATGILYDLLTKISHICRFFFTILVLKKATVDAAMLDFFALD